MGILCHWSPQVRAQWGIWSLLLMLSMVVAAPRLALAQEAATEEATEEAAMQTPAEAESEASTPTLPPYFTPTTEGDAPLWPDAGGGNSGYWITPSDGPVGDGDPAGKTPTDLYNRIAHNMFSINMVWVLLGGALVMFMQAGFMMVETGLCRAKNAAHTSAMNLMIYPLGCLAFWAYGFGIGWGNWWNAPVAPGWYSPIGAGTVALDSGYSITTGEGDEAKSYGLFGTEGFFLNGLDDVSVMTLFFFMMVFMDTTATIPTGTLAERWAWKNFVLFGLWIALPYCLYAHWVWGGGWLAQAGKNWGLGHGAVDFAGSGVVHSMGGIVALVGGLLIGPRIGKYVDGKPRAIPGHNIPMVVCGTFILAFGWFGFNAGSTLSGTDLRISTVVVNTMLASVAGAFSCMLWLMMTGGKKPDPSMICNGMLAGLVAVTAPCAFIDSWAAVLIGAIAGVLVVISVLFWDRMGVDDPVGAISVHGVNGIWGVISLGLFANGKYGMGWNGVVREQWDATLDSDGILTDGVRGLFYGDSSQLMAQLLSAGTVLVFGAVTSFILFKICNLITPMRVPADIEVSGLDIPEMGAVGYPDFMPAPHA
ncbi:MAG TPA: ammonium transporter [Lacipirellulaceae bacterium]|nr:ammonium transporter [Lacipirellulaceae bacterium]